MFKEKSFVAAVIVILVFGSAVFYRGYTMSKEPNKKLKLAYVETIRGTDLIVSIAENKGLFKENKLEIEKNTLAKNVAPLLLSGEIDVNLSSVNSALQGYMNDQDFVLLGNINKYPINDYIVSRYPLEQMDKVKNIGVISIGGPAQINIYAIADKYGLDLSKAKFVAAQNDQTKLALLEKGSIDFVLMDISGLDLGNKYTLIEPKEAFKDVVLPSGIVSTSKKINEKPEELKKFVKAVNQSIEYIKNNKKDTIELIKSKYELSESDATRLYENIVETQKDLKYIPSKDLLVDVLRGIQNMGDLKNPDRTLDGFIYTDFATKARSIF